MQSKQFVPKYLVDLSRTCLAFATWPVFVCSVAVVCHLKHLPLQRSILKSRWADGQYIYTGIRIPSPPHARDGTRIPSTFCPIAWPIINHRLPILDRTSSSVPILPFVCLCITLPEASLSNLPLADIRDARDAHIILEAVRLNILPLITRRLSSTEREQLCSGNVFVWEEAEFKGGLERWTDGRRWKVSLAYGGGSAVGLTFSI